MRARWKGLNSGGQLEGSEGQLEESEGQLEESEGQLEGYEGQPRGGGQIIQSQFILFLLNDSGHPVGYFLLYTLYSNFTPSSSCTSLGTIFSSTFSQSASEMVGKNVSHS